MQEELRKLLQEYPYIAAKTETPGLLGEEALLKLRVTESRLYRKLKVQQRMALARLSPDESIRKLAEPADRFRDITRANPVTVDYPFSWPQSNFVASTEGEVFRSWRQECLQAMDTPEQADRLLGLLNEIALQLAEKINRPATVFEDRHAVRVEFLGAVAFVALKIEREVRLEIRELEGGWQLSSRRFDLLEPLQRPYWVEQFLLPWLDEVVLTFEENAVAAWDWLRDKLESLFHGRGALAGIEQQVRYHMCVNPGMLEAFKVIKSHIGGCQFILNSEIGDMWLNADFWAELYQKHPELIMLCHLADKSGRAKAIRDVSEVRARCLEAGLSPAGWRFLLRQGESCYRALAELGNTGAHAFMDAIDFIEWQSRAGLENPLPGSLAQAFMSFAALVGHRQGRLQEQIDPRFARVAAEHYASLPRGAQRKAFVQDDLLEILIWMQNKKPRLDKSQWKSGWPAIWRAFEKSLAGFVPENEWSSCVSEMTLQDMRVKPLTSSKALCLEGLRMKNCVSSYAARCRKGSYRVFSICEIDSDKRVATVGLELEKNAWQLDQVKAKCNREASDEVKALARSLARLYEQSFERYRARNRSVVAPASAEPRESSPRRFLHLRLGAEHGLMARNDQGQWEVAKLPDLPLPNALADRLGEFHSEQTQERRRTGIGDLAIALRLELPSNYRVFIRDEKSNRDRLLTLR
jgi:hypothetical protein